MLHGFMAHHVFTMLMEDERHFIMANANDASQILDWVMVAIDDDQ